MLDLYLQDVGDADSDSAGGTGETTEMSPTDEEGEEKA